MTDPSTQTRRNFLKKSALTSVAFVALSQGVALATGGVSDYSDGFLFGCIAPYNSHDWSGPTYTDQFGLTRTACTHKCGKTITV